MSHLYTISLVFLLPVVLRHLSRFQALRRRAANKPTPAHAAPSLRRSIASTPLQATVLTLYLVLVATSLRNLVPVRYAFTFTLSLPLPLPPVPWARAPLSSLFASSPTASASAPLAWTLRGGYLSDLFLHLSAPITLPTASLRSLLVNAPSLASLGFTGTESELQALVARLSSYDARKLYLVVGFGPLVKCQFCHAARDYTAYAIPSLVAQYAWRILAVGLMTVSPCDAMALLIHRALRRFWPQQPSQLEQRELSRSAARHYAIGTLLAMLLGEGLLVVELAEVRAGQGRWNHWNANLHLVRQALFLLIATAVFCLARPMEKSRLQRITDNLVATRSKVEKMAKDLEALDAARAVVRRDAGLGEVVRRWGEAQREHGEAEVDGLIEVARSRGVDVDEVMRRCAEFTSAVVQEGREVGKVEAEVAVAGDKAERGAAGGLQAKSSTVGPEGNGV
ncbi:hypothetical protein ACQY0O_001094 [Thecaphora frezii]